MKVLRQRRHTDVAESTSFSEVRWVGTRERTSTGTRLIRRNEFFHSRIVANAAEAPLSRWETASEVNLIRGWGWHSRPQGGTSRSTTYDGRNATRLSSSLRAKMSCESVRPSPG